MHIVSPNENRKRGCIYCIDSYTKRADWHTFRFCIHEKCPYRELGKYDTYEEYLANEHSDIYGELLEDEDSNA